MTRGILVSYLVKSGCQQEDAKDLVEQAFLQIWRVRNSLEFRNSSMWFGFCKLVVDRLRVDQIRKGKRAKSVAADIEEIEVPVSSSIIEEIESVLLLNATLDEIDRITFEKNIDGSFEESESDVFALARNIRNQLLLDTHEIQRFFEAKALLSLKSDCMLTSEVIRRRIFYHERSDSIVNHFEGQLSAAQVSSILNLISQFSPVLEAVKVVQEEHQTEPEVQQILESKWLWQSLALRYSICGYNLSEIQSWLEEAAIHVGYPFGKNQVNSWISNKRLTDSVVTQLQNKGWFAQ